MKQTLKKIALSLTVILLFIFFLKYPFDKKSSLAQVDDPLKVNRSSVGSSRMEGFFYFNKEYSKYRKSVTSVLPRLSLEKFRAIAKQNGVGDVKEKSVQGRTVAWYEDRSGKTHGFMSWELEKGDYVLYEIESLNQESKNSSNIVFLSEQFDLIMSAEEGEKEVYLFESEMQIENMHNIVRKYLKSMGYEDQEELMKHKKMQNFAYFSHEKQNCFVQYQPGEPFNSLSIVFQKKE